MNPATFFSIIIEHLPAVKVRQETNSEGTSRGNKTELKKSENCSLPLIKWMNRARRFGWRWSAVTQPSFARIENNGIFTRLAAPVNNGPLSTCVLTL